MRSPHAVVLERNSVIEGTFATEPHEVGWATEAIWFVDMLDQLDADWSAHVEISPDGLRWLPHSADRHALNPLGVTAVSVVHFGTWLRLVLSPSENAPGSQARLMVTLTLK